MGDRKGKRKGHEINGSAHESTVSAAARAYGGGEDGGGSEGASGAQPIQDNPGQNAPRSAPVADEPRGRPTGRQPGVGIGGSTPRPRRDLQLQGRAQGSGNRPPTPMVCPDCHHSVFSNNTICVHCACEAARKVMVGPRPPTPPLQRQQRPPHGLQGRWSPANLEFVADRPTGQQRGGPPGGPPAIENSRPGLLGPPQENPVPRASESLSTRRRGTLEKQPKPITKTKTYVCPACHVNICSSNRVVCQPCATAWAAVPATSRPPEPHDQRPPRPQQQQQPPPPVDASAQKQQQQQQLQQMAELAADIWPVGERGGGSAAQLGHPGLQRAPQEHQVPRADKPVGFHYNPVVLGPGPDPEDGWCPSCRFYPARTVLQPQRHDCVCYTCLYVDRMVCPVCASA